MTNDLTIRVDDEADYRDVLDAVAAFNRDAGRPLIWCGGRRLALVATAHDGDALVGAAGLHRATWRGRHVLVWIWTHPQHRRRGVATELLEALEDRLGPVLHQEPGTDDGHAWQASITRRLERVWCLGYDEALHPHFAPHRPGPQPALRPVGRHLERIGFTPDRLVQLARAHTLLAHLITEHETGGRTVELIRHWHTGGATPELAIDLRAVFTPTIALCWEMLQSAPEGRIGPDAWRELFDIVGFTHHDNDRFGHPAERPAEPVRLYRGAIPERADGWMWTDDLDEARFYATNGGLYHGDVWTLTAPPDRLMATLDQPGCAMQYVIDPRGLPVEHVESLLDDAPRAQGRHFGAAGVDRLFTLDRIEQFLAATPAQRALQAATAPAHTWGIGLSALQAGAT